MDHSVRSDTRLEMSVSFGRFENDALSWEKWSSFSPNKYLDEVGSLSTPGSVAQKKAYFEAHYKKIAAQKAEALEQEKAMSPDTQNTEAFAENSSEIYSESGSSNGTKLIEEKVEQFCFSISPYEGVNKEKEDDGKAMLSGEFEAGLCKTPLLDSITFKDERGNCVSVAEGALDEVSSDVHLLMTDAESNTIDSRGERLQGSAALEKLDPMKRENIDSNNSGNVAQKVSQSKRSLPGAKKKVASPAIKQVEASISAPQSMKKKSGASQLKNKNVPVVDNRRRLAPTSLHMSLNSGSAKSWNDPSLTLKKSLIMEKLGDKDIVRRAFKTFHKRDNASSSAQKPSPVKHESSSTSIKPKIPVPRTPLKGNERLSTSIQNSEKKTTPRCSSGTRSNPLPSGSRNMLMLDKKYATAFSHHTLMNNEKAEKRKEFIKKLEANSIARAAERTSKANCS